MAGDSSPIDMVRITFDTVGVFGLAFQLLFKSCSTYCVLRVGGLDVRSP